MAVSADVNLPRSHKAVFPDRCVVCGRGSPGSHVRLITGTLGWFGRPFVAKAPACRGCAWKIHGRRLLSLAITLSIGALVIWLIWPHVREAVPRVLRRWVALGIVLVCLIPQFLFEFLFARPFDVTAYEDSVDYEFTSKTYALEFLGLNIDAEWVKLDGAELRPISKILAEEGIDMTDGPDGD